MIVIDMDMPKSCELCRAVCSRYNENEKDIEFFCGIDGGYISNYVEDLKRKRDACPIKCDIKDIKAEIEQIAKEESDEMKWSKGLHYALMIIDKHTK